MRVKLVLMRFLSNSHKNPSNSNKTVPRTKQKKIKKRKKKRKKIKKIKTKKAAKHKTNNKSYYKLIPSIFKLKLSILKN